MGSVLQLTSRIAVRDRNDVELLLEVDGDGEVRARTADGSVVMIDADGPAGWVVRGLADMTSDERSTLPAALNVLPLGLDAGDAEVTALRLLARHGSPPGVCVLLSHHPDPWVACAALTAEASPLRLRDDVRRRHPDAEEAYLRAVVVNDATTQHPIFETD
jgi:hypothetical protein